MSGYVQFQPVLYEEQVVPIVVGTLVSFIIFGIGITQFYYAYSDLVRLHALNGRITDWFVVIMMGLLFIADLGDTVGKGFWVMDFLRQVILRGLTSMVSVPKSVFSLCITDGVIVLLTAMIYIRRIYRISPHKGKWWMKAWGVFAVGIAFMQCVFAIITGRFALQPVATWQVNMNPSADLWLAGAAFSDWLLCLTFVWSISRWHSDYKQTQAVIERAIAFSLETGLLVGILQALDLILFKVFPGKPYHIAVATILPKLYINSVLILLRNTFENQLGSKPTLVSSNGFSTGQFQSGVRSQQDASFNGRAPYAANGVVVTSTKSYEHDVELPHVGRTGGAPAQGMGGAGGHYYGQEKYDVESGGRGY